MSVIDSALQAILKGANPELSDQDIAAQVQELKKSGGEAVNQALSFIPGLNSAKDIVSNAPALAAEAGKTPMGASVASALTGGPVADNVPNPGNPIADVSQGIVAGLANKPTPPPPPVPSATPTIPTPPAQDENTPEPADTTSAAPSTSPQPNQMTLPAANSADNDTRNANLAADLSKRKGMVIPQVVAGLGDAAATGLKAFGINAPTDKQEKLMEMAHKNFEESQGLFENKLKNDPNSDVSKGYRDMVAQIAPEMAKDPNFQNLSAQAIGDKLPLIDTMMKAKASKDAKEASLAQAQSNKDLSVSLRNDQQQDKLEQNAKQMVANLRGDKSLARTEEQRDAAAIAYNRLKEIQTSGKGLNPIDYTDILGQIYKARTGTAPSETIMKDIHQATAKGSLDKAYTYVTGQQAPATTQDITKSLMNMAQSMGNQADKFHQGYMNSHLIKPSGLEDERWQPILKTGRGMSFADATNQSGSTQPTQEPTKTIGGKTYVSHNGQWYEAQ